LEIWRTDLWRKEDLENGSVVLKIWAELVLEVVPSGEEASGPPATRERERKRRKKESLCSVRH
jgi:hypothetical protein